MIMDSVEHTEHSPVDQNLSRILPDQVDFRELESQLDETMLIDRHRLARQLRAIRESLRAGKPTDRNLAKFQRELDDSRAKFRARLQHRPTIEYDELLPVVQRKDDLLAAIREHQVVVICGETGSGKSTQLPKLCLELGRGILNRCESFEIGYSQRLQVAGGVFGDRNMIRIGK